MTRRRRIILSSLTLVLVSVLVLAYFYLVFPLWGMPFNAQRHGNPPLTPAWALECWLWEDDVHSAKFVDELLKGYAQHDIPVWNDQRLTVRLQGKKCPHILKIALDQEPEKIELDRRILGEDADCTYDADLKRLSIRTPEYAHGIYHFSMPDS